jgi:hypothetical protein
MKSTEITRTPALRRTILGVTVVPVATFLLLAASFWEWKPYMEWSEEETIRMLIDSPWAQSQTMWRTHFRQWTDSYESGSSDSPCDCREALAAFPVVVTRELASHYYVRFETAAPIRRAVSRLWLLKNRITRKEAEVLSQDTLFDGYIVVVVTARPKLAQSELDTICTASLRESTCVIRLEESGRNIPLCQYLSPRQVGTGEAYFIFPRIRSVLANETAVRFDCRLVDEARIVSKFKFEEMWFEGRLEI